MALLLLAALPLASLAERPIRYEEREQIRPAVPVTLPVTHAASPATETATPEKVAPEPEEVTPPQSAEPLTSAEVSTPDTPRRVATLSIDELAGFGTYPAAVQDRIRAALALTERNLGYTFASADPDRGGMDCSGTVHHLFRETGHRDIPRSSHTICQWVIDQGDWHRTAGVTSLDDPAFDALEPGDLLFWSGTYAHGERALPVSHVMLYLGTHVDTGKPVIFGASEGRRYQGIARHGVSVFDFTLPRPTSQARFYGYGGVGTR